MDTFTYIPIIDIYNYVKGCDDSTIWDLKSDTN